MAVDYKSPPNVLSFPTGRNRIFPDGYAPVARSENDQRARREGRRGGEDAEAEHHEAGEAEGQRRRREPERLAAARARPFPGRGETASAQQEQRIRRGRDGAARRDGRP